MSKVVRLSDATLERLKKYAEPLFDTPDDAVRKVLDLADSVRPQSTPAGADTARNDEVDAMSGRLCPICGREFLGRRSRDSHVRGDHVDPSVIGSPALSVGVATDAQAAVQVQASQGTNASGTGNWIALSKLIDAMNLAVVRNQAPPQKIRFPDGSVRAVRKWLRVQVNVAEWCTEKGKLSSAKCPLVLNRATLVNTTPRRQDGTGFGNPKRIGQTNLWLEGKYNAHDQVKYAIDILLSLGVDPGSVEVI